MKLPQLRPHQRDAVDALEKALADGGRAQVVMAMGTGKTLVGRAAATRLMPRGGTVAVLVPSLALVFQTLRAWRVADGPAGGITDVLTVCSADDPGEAGSHGDDAVPTRGPAAEDARETKSTTAPEQITAWLATARPGTRLLLATYHSVPRIAAAFASQPGLPPLELIIFDEAHRAASDPEAPFATALHDDRVPAKRRLFLTATPRLQVGNPDDPRGADVFPGMSDETLFGPKVYELSVSEAIRRRLLSDYRVVVVGVTDAQVHKLVMDNAPLLVGPKEADARTLAVQIALAQAARGYDLRRILVFHNRVASSRDFAAILPHTIDELPESERPGEYLTAHHVDANSTAAEREQALADLAAPESAGWTVVSNVRVLSEGVDCPALDAVVFADPREGQTTTVQAIGRALRLHPERDQPAVILIPVYLAPGENGDLVAEDSDFRSVWQILRALRDHDADIGAQLIAARRNLAMEDGGDPRPVLPDWLDLHLPAEVDASFLTSFTTRLLDGTAHIHEHGLNRLLAFVQRYGHACPEQHYIDETGFRPGRWASHRRQDRARGILDPDLAAELEALPGWVWNVPDTRFDRMVARLRDYTAEYGNTRPPNDYKSPDGADLSGWVHVQRRRYRAGTLDRERIAELESVPGWSWQSGLDERWEAGLEHLRAFASQFGHAYANRHYRAPDGFELGKWIIRQRRRRRHGQMPGNQVLALEAVPGWGWTGPEAHQERMLAAVVRYHAVHGAVPMPRNYRPDHDPDLSVGEWTARQIADHNASRMSPELAARFEKIPGFAWGQLDAAFREVLRRLADYADNHGTATPPSRYVTDDGYPLGQQALSLRTRYADGSLSTARIQAIEQLPGWTWKALRPASLGPARERFTRMVSELHAYAAEHGTCVISRGTVRTSEGRDLGVWVNRQRVAYRDRRLTEDQITALEEIPGWSWDRREQVWERDLARLRAYAAEHGTATPPPTYSCDDGYTLGTRVTDLRLRHRDGSLPGKLAQALEQIPGWTWELANPGRVGSEQERFTRAVRELHAYAAEHGTCTPPEGTRAADGRDLGKWTIRQRKFYREGRLAKDQIEALEAIPGWYWNHNDHLWEQGLARLRAYTAEHGTADVPTKYVTDDGFSLGNWVIHRRSTMREGRMPADRAAILDSLPGWCWKHY